MHDNKNVSANIPSDADQQRSTYSEYYEEFFFKGGVALIFCGWIRLIHLISGGICDSTIGTLN